MAGVTADTNKADLLNGLLESSPTRSPRPLVVVKKLKQERNYQQWMRTTCGNSTHRSPCDRLNPRVLRVMDNFIERPLWSWNSNEDKGKLAVTEKRQMLSISQRCFLGGIRRSTSRMSKEVNIPLYSALMKAHLVTTFSFGHAPPSRGRMSIKLSEFNREPLGWSKSGVFVL